MYKPICEDQECPLSAAAHYWTDITMFMAASRGSDALPYISGMRAALAIVELNPEYAREIATYSNIAHEEGRLDVPGHALSPEDIARRIMAIMPLKEK